MILLFFPELKLTNLLWSPARLPVAIIVVGQTSQVAAIDPHDVNFTTIIIADGVEIGRKSDPLPIGRKTWALAVASGRGYLMQVGTICIHDK